MFASTKKMDRRRLAVTACTTMILISALLTDTTLAGTGGTELNPIWTTITGWIQGTFGKILAAAIIIVGIAAGVGRQSLMSFAIGIFGGIGLYNTPVIIDNIMTATLEPTLASSSVVFSLSNGLVL